MKKKISILLILLFASFAAFSQKNEDLYSKINKQVQAIGQLQDLDVLEVSNAAFEDIKKYNSEENMLVSFKNKQLVKVQYYAKLGNTGNYESITIYLHGKKPILIEKEKKETITARHTDGKVESFPFLNKSKTYVQNWGKNEIAFLLWDEKTDTYQPVKKEMSDIIYDAEKLNVVRLINLAEINYRKSKL